MATEQGDDASIRRIVVGVDGSEGAERAVHFAARLGRATGAEVIAAHTVGTPVFGDGFAYVGQILTDEWVRNWESWKAGIRETLERDWCGPLADAGVAFRAEALDGGVEALIGLARSSNADVIVVGRRGRGGFAELVLGSFSHHLVHHAHQPVIVVPA